MPEHARWVYDIGHDDAPRAAFAVLWGAPLKDSGSLAACMWCLH
jgi:hypothetical protein